MLRHFLAALAYRTQKARPGAPEDFVFADIDPSNVRSNVSENQAAPYFNSEPSPTN
jgi:hypothetical protein